MRIPPTDPRRRPVSDDPTWTGVVVRFAMVAAIPLTLWVVARPLVHTVALAAVVALFAAVRIGARRVWRLAWCVQHCRELTFDLAGAVQITVARVPTDDPN